MVTKSDAIGDDGGIWIVEPSLASDLVSVSFIVVFVDVVNVLKKENKVRKTPNNFWPIGVLGNCLKSVTVVSAHSTSTASSMPVLVIPERGTPPVTVPTLPPSIPVVPHAICFGGKAIG